MRQRRRNGLSQGTVYVTTTQKKVVECDMTVYKYTNFILIREAEAADRLLA